MTLVLIRLYAMGGKSGKYPLLSHPRYRYSTNLQCCKQRNLINCLVEKPHMVAQVWQLLSINVMASA